MDGSFVDERTDLGLELELIINAQISSQDAMFQDSKPRAFQRRVAPSLSLASTALCWLSQILQAAHQNPCVVKTILQYTLEVPSPTRVSLD